MQIVRKVAVSWWTRGRKILLSILCGARWWCKGDNAARLTKIIRSAFSALTFDKTTRDRRKHGQTCVRMLEFRYHKTTVLAENGLGSSPPTLNGRQKCRLLTYRAKNRTTGTYMSMSHRFTKITPSIILYLNYVN